MKMLSLCVFVYFSVGVASAQTTDVAAAASPLTKERALQQLETAIQNLRELAEGLDSDWYAQRLEICQAARASVQALPPAPWAEVHRWQVRDDIENCRYWWKTKKRLEHE